jgi:hypothetical protein
MIMEENLFEAEFARWAEPAEAGEVLHATI